MAFSPTNRRLKRKSRNPRYFRPQLESLEELTLLSAGSLDPTFGTGGEVFTDPTVSRLVNREVLQPDGKIVVVGNLSNAPYTSFSVARFNADGSPDLAFGQGGTTTISFFNGQDEAHGVAVQADGKIVVVGSASGPSSGYFAVARFNSDGTLDTSFGSGGEVTTDFGSFSDGAANVVIQPDGKILVVGGGGAGSYAMARYNPDGSLDGSFGNGGKVIANFSNDGFGGRFLALQADGKIVVAGNGADGLQETFLVARFNQDGSPDTTFATTGVVTFYFNSPFDQAQSLLVQGDGKIVVVGTTQDYDYYWSPSFYQRSYTAIALARLNPDGTFDQTFGTAGKVITHFGSLSAGVAGAVVQPDGGIVVLGGLGAPNQSYLDLVRYSGNGQLDPTFGNGGQSLISSSVGAIDIALEPNGKFMVVADNPTQNSYNLVFAQFLGGANPVPGPFLTATGIPGTATEGQSFSGQVATFTDPDATATPSDFTATIDWADGSPSAGTIIQPGGPGTAFVVTGSHTWVEEGSLFFRVTITANTGDTFFATEKATMNDASLTSSGIPVTASAGLSFSGSVATLTDANPGATFYDDFVFPPPGSGIEAPNASQIRIDWGDGSPVGSGSNDPSLTQPGGPGTPFLVNSSHTYAKPGSYTINITITDNGGSTTSTTTTATVTNPDPSEIVGRLGPNGELFVGVSTGSSFNSSVWGRLDPSITWVDVVSGDFTGDGHTDLAARDAATGTWWVAVSNGSSFTVSQWGSWYAKVSWTDVQVGDFTGDGKMDIIGRPAGTGDWWVSTSTGSSFTNSLWARWYSKETWVDVKVGDFNGDGKADITGRDLNTGAWWTGLSAGSSFTTTLWAIWNPNVTWVDVQVGHFTGNGPAGITGRVRETGQWWTGVSNGSGFATSLWATWDPTVTWVDVKVGDFNGDGKEDIIGRDLANGQWWVAVSVAPSIDGIGNPFYHFESYLWATWSTAFTWVDVQVGDFNGDGKADITGRALESGQWWTGVSTGSSLSTTLWDAWSAIAIDGGSSTVYPLSVSDVHHGDFA